MFQFFKKSKFHKIIKIDLAVSKRYEELMSFDGKNVNQGLFSLQRKF